MIFFFLLFFLEKVKNRRENSIFEKKKNKMMLMKTRPLSFLSAEAGREACLIEIIRTKLTNCLFCFFSVSFYFL